MDQDNRKTTSIIFPSVREYTHEKYSEYRGTVCQGARELDVCTHRHRTREAAMRCAKRMMRAMRCVSPGKPLIDLL